jgi:hypothetical protein
LEDLTPYLTYGEYRAKKKYVFYTLHRYFPFKMAVGGIIIGLYKFIYMSSLPPYNFPSIVYM